MAGQQGGKILGEEQPDSGDLKARRRRHQAAHDEVVVQERGDNRIDLRLIGQSAKVGTEILVGSVEVGPDRVTHIVLCGLIVERHPKRACSSYETGWRELLPGGRFRGG